MSQASDRTPSTPEEHLRNMKVYDSAENKELNQRSTCEGNEPLDTKNNSATATKLPDVLSSDDVADADASSHKTVSQSKGNDLSVVSDVPDLVESTEKKDDVVDVAEHGDKRVSNFQEDGLDEADVRPDLPVSRQPVPKIHVGPADFELISVIGRGAFGKVLQVRHKLTNKLYAMKVLHKRFLMAKGQVSYTHVERQVLAAITHPYLVSLKFAFQTPQRLYLVMNYCSGGELFMHLNREGMLLEDDVRIYAAEMVLAIEYLHKNGIIHRDLKPENVLLNADGHVCLTDYGLAKIFADGSERTKTVCGTNEYMAPEMVARSVLKKQQEDAKAEAMTETGDGSSMKSEASSGLHLGKSFATGTGLRGGYGKGVDWWSLGALVYEMLTGRPPFQAHNSNKNPHKLYKKILTDKPPLPRYLSASAHSLLKGLLTKNPEQRLGCAPSSMFKVGGVAALKRHPFFESIDWDALERKEISAPTQISSTLTDDIDTRHFDEEFTSEPVTVIDGTDTGNDAADQLMNLSKVSIPKSSSNLAAEQKPDMDCPSNVTSAEMWKNFSFVAPDVIEEYTERQDYAPVTVIPTNDVEIARLQRMEQEEAMWCEARPSPNGKSQQVLTNSASKNKIKKAKKKKAKKKAAQIHDAPPKDTTANPVSHSQACQASSSPLPTTHVQSSQVSSSPSPTPQIESSQINSSMLPTTQLQSMHAMVESSIVNTVQASKPCTTAIPDSNTQGIGSTRPNAMQTTTNSVILNNDQHLPAGVQPSHPTYVAHGQDVNRATVAGAVNWSQLAQRKPSAVSQHFTQKTRQSTSVPFGQKIHGSISNPITTLETKRAVPSACPNTGNTESATALQQPRHTGSDRSSAGKQRFNVLAAEWVPLQSSGSKRTNEANGEHIKTHYTTAPLKPHTDWRSALASKPAGSPTYAGQTNVWTTGSPRESDSAASNRAVQSSWSSRVCASTRTPAAQLNENQSDDWFTAALEASKTRPKGKNRRFKKVAG